MFLKNSLIFYFVFMFTFNFKLIQTNRRRRLLRVGIRPDPPLAPFTNTSNLYISYTSFLRGFVKSQGIFNQYAPIPTNSTYATFMNSVTAAKYGDDDGEDESGVIKNRNDLSLFMAHVLVESRGFCGNSTLHQTKEKNIFDGLTLNYNRRGYFGIKGLKEYEEASLSIFKDLRLLETPEIVSKNEMVNWKVSIWKWKRSASARIMDLKEKSGEIVFKVYKILKKEWDPKSESY